MNVLSIDGFGQRTVFRVVDRLHSAKDNFFGHGYFASIVVLDVALFNETPINAAGLQRHVDES